MYPPKHTSLDSFQLEHPDLDAEKGVRTIIEIPYMEYMCLKAMAGAGESHLAHSSACSAVPATEH